MAGPGRPRAALAVAVAFAAGALSLATRLDAAARHRPVAASERTVEATVAAQARFGGFTRLELRDAAPARPGAPPVPSRIRVSLDAADAGSPLERSVVGDRLRARLRLRPPRGLRNPGGRRGERDLARAGVGASARPVHPALAARRPEAEGWRPGAGLRRARRTWIGRLETAGPGGALLAALAFGERGSLPPEARDAFARLGIAHLLAVSGLHLALVGGAAFAAARVALARSARLAARRDPRDPALAAALLVAAAYALLAGWGVPVRRALVLLAGLALAVARGRPGARGHPLCAAALLVLALEPQALFAAGAQLSFAASAALLGAAAPRDPASPGGAAGALRDLLRATATAAAATAPLAAWTLGVSAPLALVANAVAVPWTAVALLPASLVAAGAAALSGAPGAGLALAAAERMAAATLEVAEYAAERVPLSDTGLRPGWPGVALGAAFALAALRARGTAARAALAVLAAAAPRLAPPPELPPAPPRLVAFDVGRGDAILVQGREAAVLVDAGTALPGGSDLGARVVVPALRALGVRRLDLLAVTHADLDHRGGAPSVLRALPVAAVWTPFGASRDPDWSALRASARERGVPVAERGAGSPALRLGDLRLVPLWPPRRGGPPDRNDRSLVLRVELPGVRALLPADLEAEGERALGASGADLRADLLLLPHHGRRSSSTAAFLRAVDPALAVASAPCGGPHPVPHPEVEARVRARGAPLWWTGRDGAVLVSLAPPLAVAGHADPRRCLPDPD